MLCYAVPQRYTCEPSIIGLPAVSSILQILLETETSFSVVYRGWFSGHRQEDGGQRRQKLEKYEKPKVFRSCNVCSVSPTIIFTKHLQTSRLFGWFTIYCFIKGPDCRCLFRERKKCIICHCCVMTAFIWPAAGLQAVVKCLKLVTECSFWM